MAAKGIRERVLNPALRKQRLSVRKARSVINVVFDSIQDALARHERVELPIGVFTVLPNSKKRGYRFGKFIDIPKYRVKFLPSDELKLAAAAAPLRKKKLSKSELSAELIVDFIRKNVPPGMWRSFFHELRAGFLTQAVFDLARPKPGEFRPLDEAVIHECAPAKMPDDPREQFNACIAWFARWSQRVILKTIFQQAVEQAEKTLLGA